MAQEDEEGKQIRKMMEKCKQCLLKLATQVGKWILRSRIIRGFEDRFWTQTRVKPEHNPSLPHSVRLVPCIRCCAQRVRGQWETVPEFSLGEADRWAYNCCTKCISKIQLWGEITEIMTTITYNKPFIYQTVITISHPSTHLTLLAALGSRNFDYPRHVDEETETLSMM